MLSQRQYLKFVRFSAWSDVIMTGGFVTPWSFSAIYAALAAIASEFSLAGSVPDFDPLHMLIANQLGIVIMLWVVVRLRNTRAEYGRYDAIARFISCVCQVFAVANGASVLILGFTAVEFVMASLQCLPYQAVTDGGAESTLGSQAREHIGS